MNTSVTSVLSRNALSRWIDAIFTWIERIQRKGFLVAVAAQFLVLCGMILMQMIPHLSGNTVWLKVVPVDPRDMFRGDYVILSYEMSRAPADFAMQSDEIVAVDAEGVTQPAPPDILETGTVVYVTLVLDADGVHHRADQFLTEPPADGLYIRGTLQGGGRIEYGIESFYVQAGTGLEYEEAARTGTLSAEVGLSGDGQAGLRQLQVNKR